MAFSALLGGVGFSAFTHGEKTQKQKMGADTGSFGDQDDAPAGSVAADEKLV